MHNDLMTAVLLFLEERVDAIEAELHSHSEAHPQYAAAVKTLDDIIQNDQADAKALSDAWQEYSSELALEMYAHGLCDGSRILNALLKDRKGAD